MKYGVKTDKGIVRDINEDSYNIISGCTGVPDTFIIADGLGGHNSGEVASRMAVEFIGGCILQDLVILSDENYTGSGIRKIMEEANLEIYNKSKEHESTYGMGTTLVMAVLAKNCMHIGNVGDSRLYLIREQEIEQITTDHSFVEELIKNGSLTRREAGTHPRKNIITRALGCSDTIKVDTCSCNIKTNDIILLCTDGLTNMLNENEIKDIVIKYEDPQFACNELVRKANQKGGEDNITVIIVKIE